MKNIKQIVFVIAVVFCLASTVFAQPPSGQHQGGPPHGGHGGGGDPGQAVLQALDTDGNHEISAQEMADAAKSLQKLDTNGDGKLSDADAGQSRGGDHRRGSGGGSKGGKHHQAGGKGDRQGPPHGGGGPPSPEEFVKHAMEFDADKDGKLDATELAVFAQQMGPPSHGPGHEHHGTEGRQERPDRPARPER